MNDALLNIGRLGTTYSAMTTRRLYSFQNMSEKMLSQAPKGITQTRLPAILISLNRNPFPAEDITTVPAGIQSDGEEWITVNRQKLAMGDAVRC
jgi:hypothetical protein